MFDQIKLQNGLTIVGEKLPHFRSVSMGVWISAGSQYESIPENGLSHFLEHMLFKGTERRSALKIAEAMDAVGGQLNAFTAKELTCFYAKVIDEHAELAMDVLSDIVLHSVFDPTELDKEKGVVLEEISMVEDEPEDLVHELIMRAHYGEQSLARPILGIADTVRGFDRERLVNYRDRMYRADCAVLAVAGNYDWPALIEMAEKYFGEWTAGESKCAGVITQPVAPQLIRREKDIEQLHICLSFPGYGQGGEEVYPLSIFNSVFGGAMSSHLFQKIREQRGMAYSVYSYPSFYTGTGIFAIYAGTSLAHAPTVLELIGQEIDLMVKDGITREEFDQTRAQLKGGYVLGQESASARMNALGRRMLLMGNTQTEDDVLGKIDAVQYDDVNRILKEVLSGGRAAALVGKGAGTLDMSAIMGSVPDFV